MARNPFGFDNFFNSLMRLPRRPRKPPRKKRVVELTPEAIAKMSPAELAKVVPALAKAAKQITKALGAINAEEKRRARKGPVPKNRKATRGTKGSKK